MKKVNLFIILIIFISFVSCSFSENNKACPDFQIQATGKVCFNEQIDNFLTDFFNEIQEDSCIYELYVDKKNRDEYQLTLLCERADREYFEKNYPVNYTTINGKTIFIYSGIEDFVDKDTYSTNFKSIDQTSSEYIHVWYKVILKDTSYIVKADLDIINPFCTATLNGIIEFKSPSSP